MKETEIKLSNRVKTKWNKWPIGDQAYSPKSGQFSRKIKSSWFLGQIES